jgi:hypothetical protein
MLGIKEINKIAIIIAKAINKLLIIANFLLTFYPLLDNIYLIFD